MGGHEAPRQRATAEQIRAIIGEVDDQVVSEIVQIGPSDAEVLLARSWRAMSPAQRVPGEFELHGRAARVLEVLDRIDLPAEPDRG